MLLKMYIHLAHFIKVFYVYTVYCINEKTATGEVMMCTSVWWLVHSLPCVKQNQTKQWMCKKYGMIPLHCMGWVAQSVQQLTMGWTVWDRIPVGMGFSAHPASCTMGTGSSLGVKCGRGVLLTTHPLLVPQSWKSRAIPLPTLWATPGL